MNLSVFYTFGLLFVFGIPQLNADSPGKRDGFRFYPLRNGFNRIYRWWNSVTARGVKTWKVGIVQVEFGALESPEMKRTSYKMSSKIHFLGFVCNLSKLLHRNNHQTLIRKAVIARQRQNKIKMRGHMFL